MFLAGSTDRWQWSEDVFPPVDVCGYALLRDGLHVAPFDVHPDGDGRLRESGLDAATWRRWLTAVMAQHGRLSAFAKALGSERGPAGPRDQDKKAQEVISRPGSCCPGSPALRARLDELWTGYEPAGSAWKQAMTIGQGALRPCRCSWSSIPCRSS